MSKWMIVFILLFSVFHDIPTASANTESVVVDAPSVHIRSGAGLTYAVTGSLKKGDQVEVIAVSGDWYQIQHGNSSGWIASWLTASADKSTGTSTAVVSRVNQLNVRSSPSTNSAVLGRMAAGDEAIATGNDGEWTSITFNGINGWVHTDYITAVANQTAPKATNQATSPESFTVSVDSLNVRKNADLSSKRIGLINQGESYDVKEVNGNWVHISLGDNESGWVYSFHGALSSNDKQDSEGSNIGTVTILSNGTNIREAATTSSQIAALADAGEKFPIVKQDGDWYEIYLPTGASAFVATWVVSTGDESLLTEPVMKESIPRVAGTLKGLTIVIDPGHGGNDRGTTGTRGTDEKDITILTSELLAAKLKAAGAIVITTRETDTYVSLRKRVAISNQHAADAFISLHYDANPDSSVAGFTTYYAHAQQQALASTVNEGLASSVNLRNRGSQPGDFLVLRENRQNAILIELGFLSNSAEERTVTSDMFRERATHGIYQGLLDYFNTN
ncbi:N-acetylmuramoyl-L-alanine amidase [Sporosarcina sp. E16_8]|uniref:N-acetylmuramoyl-L-alanine amidase n=1 Tax=Sporosarcina sp. E16_8 TaxID=2789295 RepID=UPI001A90F133|nr:N-acetylmuramoyl-L-alanine amidase [Sporosarcina sp. E16_8]MBO0587050.1 N-acetylmuramoyl-L-alanine amidase [Sporosarcina sp. E16_8]